MKVSDIICVPEKVLRADGKLGDGYLWLVEDVRHITVRATNGDLNDYTKLICKSLATGHRWTFFDDELEQEEETNDG